MENNVLLIPPSSGGCTAAPAAAPAPGCDAAAEFFADFVDEPPQVVGSVKNHELFYSCSKPNIEANSLSLLLLLLLGQLRSDLLLLGSKHASDRHLTRLLDAVRHHRWLLLLLLLSAHHALRSDHSTLLPSSHVSTLRILFTEFYINKKEPFGSGVSPKF
jgi:hypothetical protein